MSESKPSWRRGWRLAVLVTSPLWLLGLLFGVGEGVMRAIHSHDPSSFPAAMTARPAEGATTEDGLPIFGRIKQLRAPNVHGVFRGQIHRTDSIGFRGPQREAEGAPGTRRVLVTGDSIAMGSGVEELAAFPMVTERWLREHASPPDWEVVNTALAGMNLRGALDRLEQGIAAYGGDLYVYPFVPNDIEGKHYERFPAERTALDLVKEGGWAARSDSALIRVVAWEWLDLWDRIHALNAAHYTREIHFNYFENPPAWAELALGLDRLAQLGRTHDRCVVVLIQTRLVALDPDEHPFLAIYDKAAAAARLRGFHVVETRDVFLGRDPAEIRYSQLDPHPNDTGHRLLGEALGEGIRALPDSCWSR